MWDAFISYARDDLALTERLHTALTQSGKSIWRDIQDIAAGEVFWNRIEDAIAGSHYLLFDIPTTRLGRTTSRRKLITRQLTLFCLRSLESVLPADSPLSSKTVPAATCRSLLQNLNKFMTAVSSGPKSRRACQHVLPTCRSSSWKWIATKS